MTTTVVILTVECENGHQTEVKLIGPVIAPDGSVEGHAGSQADFCDVCDSSEMEHVSAELAEVEIDPADAYLYMVKRHPDGYCTGCGTSFRGPRGLRAHQSQRFVTLACKA